MAEQSVDRDGESAAALKALREALIAGEESGSPRIFDSAAFLKRMRQQQEG